MFNLIGDHSRTLATSVAIPYDGWRQDPYGFVYQSATSVYLGGDAATLDVSAQYQVGEKVTWNDGATKYGYIVGVAYSTNTILTIAGDAVTNTALSNAATSLIQMPLGFPQWFDWTPTLTGWSVNPTNALYRFCIVGRLVTAVISQGSAGTSNATTATVSLPVTAKDVPYLYYGGANNFATDNGADLTTPTRWVIGVGAGASVVAFYKDMVAGAWTASGGKRIFATVAYEMAG